ncbi:MAG: hypothetical protein L0Z50_43380 [Verrucomicrobiales bacterium]|nr:hypothetical protein [Verrucomicrobiales bacterium]
MRSLKYETPDWELLPRILSCIFFGLAGLRRHPYGERPDYGHGSWVLAHNPRNGLVEEITSPGAYELVYIIGCQGRRASIPRH